METTPLVSIIIPVYNVEEYLRECVDSVINQTYKNLEIILVDDGSTDSSGKICDEYAEKDKRINVIHQQNGGLSVARNTGFDASNGKYIYFLDSDDYIEINAIELLVSISEKENCDIVFFDAVSFADTNDFKVNQNYIRKNTYATASGYEVFSAMVTKKEFHSAVPLLFIKRDYLINSKIRFVPDIYYEDMVFTFQLFNKAFKVSQCSKSLYHRRYRKNSIMTSSKSIKHFTGCLAVYNNNCAFLKELQQDNLSCAKEFVCRCAFNVFNVYEKLSKSDKKNCKKELSDFRNTVLENKAFGNTALRMRCYGKTFWIIYKIYEKTVGRLLKGKK